MTTELHAPYHIAMPTAFNADESLNAVNTIKYMCYLKAQGLSQLWFLAQLGNNIA